MNERRISRSSNPSDAVSLYLSSLCAKSGLEAVALATDDGTLVAGAGPLDVEWMGAMGATSRRAKIDWDGRTLHVRQLEVNAVPLWLTMAGKDHGEAVGTIHRILTAQA